MRFVFPIENKTADELYKLNRKGFGGYFPIGLRSGVVRSGEKVSRPGCTG